MFCCDQEYGRIVAARRKLPRYRWHLGCILLKMPAISLLTGGSFKSFKLLYFNPDLRRLIEQYVASGPDRKALDCGASFPLRGPCLESG